MTSSGLAPGHPWIGMELELEPRLRTHIPWSWQVLGLSGYRRGWNDAPGYSSIQFFHVIGIFAGVKCQSAGTGKYRRGKIFLFPLGLLRGIGTPANEDLFPPVLFHILLFSSGGKLIEFLCSQEQKRTFQEHPMDF